MTLGVTTTIHCDGCPNILTTSWTLTGGVGGSRRWSTRKRFGWKQITRKRRRYDYCAACVRNDRAR